MEPMTRVDPLLSELRATAESEAEAIRSAARADAEARRDAARARLARQHERALAGERATLEREVGSRLDEARVAAGQAVLAARGQFIARVFEAARRQALARWNEARAVAWLRQALEDIDGYLPDGPAIVRAPRGTTLPDGPRRDWRVESLDHSSGIIVSSGDGTVSVDATFDRFLATGRARLAQGIVRRVEATP